MEKSNSKFIAMRIRMEPRTQIIVPIFFLGWDVVRKNCRRFKSARPRSITRPRREAQTDSEELEDG